MSGRRYEIRRSDGTLLGPLRSSQIRALASTGEVGPNDEIRDMEKGGWQLLSRVGGLALGSMETVDTSEAGTSRLDSSPATPPIRPPVSRETPFEAAIHSSSGNSGEVDEADSIADSGSLETVIESADVETTHQPMVDRPTDEAETSVLACDADGLESLPSPSEVITRQQSKTDQRFDIAGEEITLLNHADLEVVDESPMVESHSPVESDEGIDAEEAFREVIEAAKAIDDELEHILNDGPDDLVADIPVIKKMDIAQSS